MPAKPTNDQRRKLIERIRNEPALGWKPTHGGKRTNAGRKPASTPRKAITVRLSEPARARLEDIKRETGESFSAIIEHLLKP